MTTCQRGASQDRALKEQSDEVDGEHKTISIKSDRTKKEGAGLWLSIGGVLENAVVFKHESFLHVDAEEKVGNNEDGRLKVSGSGNSPKALPLGDSIGNIDLNITEEGLDDAEDKKYAPKKCLRDTVGLIVYLITLVLSLYTANSPRTSKSVKKRSQKPKSPSQKRAITCSFRSVLVIGTFAIVALLISSSRASGHQVSAYY